MPREFEIHRVAELDTTPEQVWEAIATGPGIDSWFVGRSHVEPAEGGAVRTDMGNGHVQESILTAWNPLKQFAYRSTGENGRFVAFDYLIEGRGGGSTVLRTVASGFLPGDDWEAEYDAMTKGGEMYFRTLVERLTHFPGRAASSFTVFGPPVAGWERTRAVLVGALGLSDPVTEGDRVRFTPDGLAPVEGVVYAVNPDTLGVRTDDAMYRFLRAFQGGLMIGHHVFSEGTDLAETERAWRAWLTRLPV